MLRETSPRPSSMLTNIFLLVAACLCLTLSATAAQGQRTTRAKAGATETTAKAAGDEPCFREYRGVQIGMTIDDARLKLGAPKDKADELDIYAFNDKESAQV